MRAIRFLPLVVAAACGGSTAKPVEPAPPAPPPAPPPEAVKPPAPTKPQPPVAARRPTTNTYHGVTVEDPYQWLEADTAEVAAWSDGQDRHTRQILDNLPGLATLREELRKIIDMPETRYGGFQPAGGKVFAFRRRAGAEQSDLVVMDAPEKAADARLIFDPTAAGDTLVSIDWFVPSPDGSKVAVSISAKGSEAGDLHVLDLEGTDVEPVIPNVQRGTGGGDMAWHPDSKGFWYTRYPRPGEKPEPERDFWMQVWWHALGTGLDKDRYELGKDQPKIAEIRLDADPSGRVLASIQNGDGGTFRHYLRAAKGGWRQLTDWNDQVVSVVFGPTPDLWLVSHRDAPRGKVLRLPARAKKLAQAKVIVPEGPDAVVTSFHDDASIVVTRDRLYVTYQQGGPDTIRAFTLAGKLANGPKLPPVSSSFLVHKPIGNDLLVHSMSYVVAPSWYRYAPATGAMTPIAAISPKPPVSLEGWEVHRELATSKDGTKVPLNIVWKTGTPRDGSTPCVVTGYGGYGISLEPNFLAGRHPLLRRGVCWVEVNLRGGGEFGEAWHRAGALLNKQNVFDDFAAALDHLVAAKYTRHDRLVIIGGSNGGLLMGALLTQHPTKMKAVASLVGVYDMLRVELSPNGQYNTTEFGTVTDAAQFTAMHAYSPYHRVVAGTRYPAVLMTSGANDPRVAPWHSRKMVAALQAAQGGDAPILLRTSATSGHGAGTAMTERIAANAHLAAFILWQLGVPVDS